MLRDFFSLSCYFTVYKHMTENDNSLTNSFIAGGLAGCFSWACIYPIDVLKTRWQISKLGEYRNPAKLLINIYKNEGSTILFKGFNATMLRSFPQHATTFITYEFLKSFLSE
eukprot:UN07326